MKCLILGNSHASVLQLALREGWSQPGLDLDIVVIPGRTQPEMRLAEGRIYPAGNLKHMRSNVEDLRSNGLDLAAYQAVWLVGFGLNGPSTLTLADGSHAFSRACHGISVDGLAVPQVSRQVMAGILAHDISGSGFLPVMQSLTGQPDLALRVVLRPRPSVRLLTAAQAELQALYGDQAETALGIYFALHDEVVATLVGTRAPVLWQSPQTMDGLFTAEPFTQPADVTHMNSGYGRLVLDQLAESMQG